MTRDDDAYLERAAILEYDGRLSRGEAERRALLCASDAGRRRVPMPQAEGVDDRGTTGVLDGENGHIGITGIDEVTP